MNNVKMSTGREVVDPFASESGEQLESTSALGGTTRVDRVVDNNSYGNCPKCSRAMPVVKNASGSKIFHCDKCRVSSPCKM